MGEGSLHKQWMNLRQKRSVVEYRRQFIARATPLEEVSMICLISKFVSGLWPEIRRELRLLRPIGMGQAMDLAQLVEDKLSPLHIRARATSNVGGQSHLRFRGATITENSTPRTIESSHGSSTTTRGEF